jgi:hypothetical protein
MDHHQVVWKYINKLAKIFGVARVSIRNEGTRELYCGIKKNNHNLLRFSFPMKEPPYSLYRRLCGAQNQSGHHGEEKHLAPAHNPTPPVHHYAHRDPTDKAVTRTDCTPLHIYFSLDFSLQLLHLCVPAPTNLTLLQFRSY